MKILAHNGKGEKHKRSKLQKCDKLNILLVVYGAFLFFRVDSNSINPPIDGFTANIPFTGDTATGTNPGSDTLYQGESKLTPLSGTLAEQRAKYEEKSKLCLHELSIRKYYATHFNFNSAAQCTYAYLYHFYAHLSIHPYRYILYCAGGVQRYLDDLLAPTPPGQEPKSIILIKSITWFAVIVLVLIELFVSVKVGGMPFELGKVSLPSLPSFFNKL